MKKYRYIGEGEVNLPKFGVTAKKGDVVESEKEIIHPEFKEITEQKTK